MTDRLVEQLAVEKAEAVRLARQRLGLLGLLALRQGTESDGVTEMWIDTGFEMNHHVSIAEQAGGVLVTVYPAEEEE